MFGEEDEEEDNSDNNEDFFTELTAMQEQMNREGDTPTTKLDEGEGTSNYPLNTAMPLSINISSHFIRRCRSICFTSSASILSK